MMHWEEHNLTPVVFFPHMQKLSLIRRKHERNSSGGAFSNILINNLQKYQGHEKQGKTEELSQLEEPT